MLIPARLSVLAALFAVGLTGCAYTVPTAQQRGPRVPTVVVRDGHDRNARHDRGARALERRLERDANRYANQLDRQLRLSNQQERRIERLLVNRGYDLVVRNGSRAYPFPRADRGRLGRWWYGTDEAIARHLNHRQRAAYYGGYSLRRDHRGHRGRDHRGRDLDRDRDD
jgi:hypothetical protein